MTPLQIALEALNRIAEWPSGDVVDSTFDSPADARIARRALADIAACPRIPYDKLVEIGSKALVKITQPIPQQEACIRIGYAVENYLRQEK